MPGIQGQIPDPYRVKGEADFFVRFSRPSRLGWAVAFPWALPTVLQFRSESP